MNPKELVAAYAKKGFSEHLFAGTSGNLSMFDPKTGKMYITASGIRYEEMTAEDVMVTDLNGAVLEGRHRPSSEWRMHAAVYRAYPGLGAVVHTHSPYATAFAVQEQRHSVLYHAFGGTTSAGLQLRGPTALGVD